MVSVGYNKGIIKNILVKKQNFNSAILIKIFKGINLDINYI